MFSSTSSAGAMPRRRSQPGRTFVIVLAAIFLLALFSLLSARVPRTPYLGRRQAFSALDEGEVPSECRKVHQQQDQCAWVHEHCADEDAGLISYLKLYFCRLPDLKPVGFLIIAAWAALLFSTIGIAASDFFCVNLSTIASILGISENMAGVTFLAFGNGSPDVFSTFAAIRSNSGSLAVGELIGAAGFITAVVSGSMALVRPFKVARKSFVRDVGFFAVSVAFSMVFCANGKLELWECAVMVAYYIFYVIVVVAWHWYLGKRRLNREKNAIARGHYEDMANNEIDFEGEEEPQRRPDTETTPLRQRLELARHASLEDFVDLERANNDHHALETLDEGTRRQQWLGEINSSMRITQTPIAERRNISGAIRPSLVGALEFTSTMHNVRKAQNLHTMPIHLRRYSDEAIAEQRSSQERDNLPVPETAPPTRAPGLHPHHASHAAHNASRTRAKSADVLAAGAPGPPNGHYSGPPLPDARRSLLASVGAERIDEVEEPMSGSPATRARAPTINVDPPVEADENEPLLSRENEGKSSSHKTPSSTHLFPPSHIGEPPMNDHHDLKPGRPHLHITPPDSYAQQKQKSPQLSPFPALRDSSEWSRPPSIVLGSPAMEHGEFVQSPVSLGPAPPPRWWPYKMLPAPSEVLQALFPTLWVWNEKTIWGKLVGIAAAPSFLLLTMSLPVVEPEASATTGPSTSMDAGGYAISPSPSPAIEALSPGGGRRLSTARVAVETEQRHKHSSSPMLSAAGNKSPAPLAQVDRAPTHPHAAVTSPTSWNRWLVVIHCFTSPYVMFLAVWAEVYEADPAALKKPSIILAVCSSVAAALVLLTTSSSRPPKWHWLLCFVGFGVSVTWISTIANEVVGVLKAIGVIFDISDAILGLTVFAVGNSLGDLVADITVARLGFPVMALSACFGGPMLNILLGVGLSGLYMTISGAQRRKHKHPDKGLRFKPYHVEVSTTLLVSAAALLVTLLGLLIVVPLNGWRMDRKIGWGLIALWVVATAGNLALELSGVADLWGIGQ